MCHAYSQAWWWECHGLRLHECYRFWRVIFHWVKYELQHVLWNTATERDSLPPETGSQGSVPAWQWPQTHLQDNNCFTEEAEGKDDGLAKHVSWLEPKRTSLGILKRKVEVRKVSNICQLRDVVMEEWKSIPVATCEALVNSMPRRVKAVLDNDGGHTKYWQLTWCMLILTTFPKECTHFCWQGFSFWWLYFELFWRENKLTLLYKLHTDYFSLCQSVILSVLSHEEIYLNICRNVRGVLISVIHCTYIFFLNVVFTLVCEIFF